MKNLFISISCLCWAMLGANAQELDKLDLIAKNKNQEICLRWSPNTPQQWLDGLQYGYRLERYTYERSGKNLEPVQKITLLSEQSPRPDRAMWEQMAKNDQYARMAKNILYYEDADTTDRQDELELRFGFSVFAAGMSPMVAEALHLGFADKTANKNEKYYYEVAINYPDIQKQASTRSRVFQDFSLNFPEPSPRDVSIIEYTDSTAVVQWKSPQAGDFTAFYLERSDDGGLSYQRIIKEPILPTSPEESIIQTKITNLFKTYWYRVVGVSPFGDESPASDPASVFAYQTRLPTPQNLSYSPFSSNKIILTWEYPDSLLINIKGFRVLRGQAGSKTTEILHENLLPTQQNYYLDSLRTQTAIYQVVAVDLRGKELLSTPILVELIDTIPPPKPSRLRGRAEKTGLVHLSWEKSVAPDLFGYQVLRADDKNEEFLLAHKQTISDTLLVDTVQLHNTQPYIYYIVSASDNHLNLSKQNDTLRVKRPDIIPPLPPTFLKKTISDTLIAFECQASPSKDVVRHRLFRADLPDTTRNLLREWEINGKNMVFGDSTVQEGKEYRYWLLAYDDADLFSEPEHCTLGIRLEVPPLRPAIKIFTAKLQGLEADLAWTYPSKKPITHYQLLRGQNPQEIFFYKRLENATVFRDTDLKPEQEYFYKIVAFFADGSETVLSQEVKIKTKRAK